MGSVAMEFKTDNIAFSIAQDYVLHFVMGFILLGAAGFTRIMWVEGWGKWAGIFVQVDPSLQASPSPLDRTLTGCGGLIAASFNAVLTIAFTILAIDQLLFWGWLWDECLDLLSSVIPLF